MAYNNLQFIAFCINTGTLDNKYVGIRQIDQDISQRVKLVANAIAKAHQEANSGPSVLKVFMMPEFFFRGPDGAYSMGEDVDKIRTKLQDLVKANKFNDWLFVFGTIVASSHPTREGRIQWFRKLFGMKKMIRNSEANAEIYNISLVQRGGFVMASQAHKSARAVMKRDMSGVDFLQDRYDDLGKLVGLRQEVQARNDDGSSIFSYTFRGGQRLTFGLEVCLDHEVGRLQQAADIQPLNILLLPSCGMVLQENKLSGFTNRGYALHCDGNLSYARKQNKDGITWWGVGGDPGTRYHSALYKKDGVNRQLVPYDSEFDVNTAGVQINKIFPRGSGKLRLYPVQPL
jgi:hypothetical protein